MNTRDRALSAAARRLKKKPTRREGVAELTLAERQTIVTTFSSLLEGLYAHLPQKRATYGHDPVQRLRALQQRLDGMDEVEFHRSMSEIVTELRDAHTRYLGPKTMHGVIAALPFLVERYVDKDGEHYIASKVFNGDPKQTKRFAAMGFVSGVELTHWNGTAMRRAIDLHAERETGGRPDARRARALESLTLRPLRYALPPAEDWVIVSFIGKTGQQHVKLEWRYTEIRDLPNALNANGMAELAYAGDPLAEAARRVKKMLYSPIEWYESEKTQHARPKTAALDNQPEERPDDYSDAVRTEKLSLPNGTEYGYLRLWSFDLIDDDSFIKHTIDLLRALPRTGLIIDLRGNPGGLIWAAERLLQLFTPNQVEPTRFSLLATDISRTMAAAPQNRLSLAPWRNSVESAVISGEQHSRSVPLTPVERCNDLGQKYPGPVVAIVDANTYSSGDLFAAGFVDNNIGILVSVDEATGAGGANVWHSHQVTRALHNTDAMPTPLPGGIEYTMAFRRATRVGEATGTSIEDKGVRGHVRRPLTKMDLQNGNRDLKVFCSRLLASETITDLQYQFKNGELSITTVNLDRIELYVDDRPHGAPTMVDLQTTLPNVFEIGTNWSKVEVLGFAGAIRRQQRLLWPDSLV